MLRHVCTSSATSPSTSPGYNWSLDGLLFTFMPNHLLNSLKSLLRLPIVLILMCCLVSAFLWIPADYASYFLLTTGLHTAILLVLIFLNALVKRLHSRTLGLLASIICSLDILSMSALNRLNKPKLLGAPNWIEST